jgi:hypothetical protein
MATTEERQVTLEQIQEYSDRIAAEFKPEQIILLGSYAYGVMRRAPAAPCATWRAGAWG